MNLGFLFILACLAICFLTASGIYMVPNAVLWSLACLSLGILLGGVGLPWGRN